MKTGSKRGGLMGMLSIAIFMVMLGIQGCATGTTTASDREEGPLAFPDPSRAWLSGGSLVTVDNLRLVHRGASRDQLYTLLGPPHFNEGIFSLDRWNYIFRLRAGEDEYVNCQYQVHFDDNKLVESTHWRTSRCATLVTPVEAEEIESDVSKLELTIASDLLFGFDSAELTLDGRRGLDEVVAILKRDFDTPELLVLGHSDRLGLAEYNQTLSEHRAEAVKSHLVSRGMQEETIRTAGRGARDPVVQCSETLARPALAECLGPNRRVQIEVTTRSAR